MSIDTRSRGDHFSYSLPSSSLLASVASRGTVENALCQGHGLSSRVRSPRASRPAWAISAPSPHAFRCVFHI
ncbi:hypothetical protein FIBSPDRAFT_875366 [Athelia psychrophila]|uniref:Uncharacterized protein n=1 Tax=Athelia psychrophila TaxID=1759441 RepID=A0A167XSZ2_9AGAM|nr:hypothetical protein FIBSPDRAFT_875366 [Fibularhizoctonia sp. CBS 109695]